MMSTQAGWYPDQTGNLRWWDGSTWGPYAPPAQGQQPAQVQYGGRQANGMTVSYTRAQTGHSLTLHILLIFVVVGMFTVPYYSISPNHYWHI